MEILNLDVYFPAPPLTMNAARALPQQKFLWGATDRMAAARAALQLDELGWEDFQHQGIDGSRCDAERFSNLMQCAAGRDPGASSARPVVLILNGSLPSTAPTRGGPRPSPWPPSWRPQSWARSARRGAAWRK